ncbi:MAG: hypothetical protein IKW21_01295 [Lachnospiraceae bacterium]|nr:hypothetical protein [Lachnospiraceae bacterium]
MKELKSITDYVEVILKADPKTRNNDCLLYIRLVDLLGKKHHIDYLHMPMILFYEQLPSLDLPTSETVGRCRRKLQQKHPELKANAEVTAFRAEREEQFKAYARS